MVVDIVLFFLLCIALWFGTGQIVSSIDASAKRLRISAFSLSFFVLGFMTSIPEIAVGTSAVIQGEPEVFVGNLLGGIPVIFLFVVPLLAILGNGIKINDELSPSKLTLTLLVIATPAILVLDRTVTNPEGIAMIFFYLFLFIMLEQNKAGILGLFARKKQNTYRRPQGFVPIKVLFGAVVVFVSAHFLLQLTIDFANALGVLPFYISLIVLSLGTNIPEISLAIRSVLKGKKDIALGDYMGSASANTLLFGVFTLMSPQESFNVNHSWITFLFIVGGLYAFYYFYRSGRHVSRREGFILLSMYIVFSLLELRQI
jgi:cation:H+ antiporter